MPMEAIATPWFMCIFTRSPTLSFDAAMRVWDCLFAEGKPPTKPPPSAVYLDDLAVVICVGRCASLVGAL